MGRQGTCTMPSPPYIYYCIINVTVCISFHHHPSCSFIIVLLFLLFSTVVVVYDCYCYDDCWLLRPMPRLLFAAHDGISRTSSSTCRFRLERMQVVDSARLTMKKRNFCFRIASANVHYCQSFTSKTPC